MKPTGSALTEGVAPTRTRVAPGPTRQHMLADLRELIAALDRRVPCLERTGETDIARDARALRNKALDRIARIEKPAS